MVFQRLKDFIAARVVLFVLIGMPCQSWTRARRNDGRGPGPLRDDDRHLYGFSDLAKHDLDNIRIGNDILSQAVKIIKLCQIANIPWILENPMTSRVWLTLPMKKLAQQASFQRADFCQYGMPWRKATYFLCSHHIKEWGLLSCLSQLGRCSVTGKKHIILQGRDAAGNFLTRKAQPYPPKLCDRLAFIISNYLKSTS